jgi:tetratricopeptide (TPR) repeat protein
MFVDAIQNYQSALESELNHFPLHYLSIIKTYNEIGDIFYRMDDYATAFSYFDKTIQIQKKSLSPNHSILAITNYNLARASDGLQQYKEAIEYASRAVNIARHSFGSHHEDVRLYESYLDELREKTLIGVIPNGAVYE